MAIFLITEVKVIGNPQAGEHQLSARVNGTDGSVADVNLITSYPGATNALKASNLRTALRGAAADALAALDPPVEVGGGDDVILAGDVTALDV
jgi:hypothetical protein